MKTCSRRKFLAAALVGFSAYMAAGPTRADSFPSRPIIIVNPFPAGGSLDNLLRMLGQKVATSIGQPVIVENKPGASSTVGTAYVGRAAPDGYTLLAQSTNFSIAPAVGIKLPYDSERDFTPVTLLGSVSQALTVPADSEVHTVQQLVALAKQNPGMITYGTLGPGTGGHMTGIAFERVAGIELTQIPFKGSSQTLQALAGGHISMAFGNLPEILEYQKGGLMRPLAIASETRSDLAPDLPTMAEAGFPGVISQPWYGILAPAGTAPDIVDRLQREFARALAQPDVVARLHAVGITIAASSPQKFKQLITNESREYAKLAKTAHISLR